MGGTEGIYRATNEYNEPVKVFVERTEPQMKQTDRPYTKPAWDGDSSEFAVLEARNKVAFRKQPPKWASSSWRRRPASSGSEKGFDSPTPRRIPSSTW